MSASGTSRAADLAAQQVEQIVTAAEQAAEQIAQDARAELEDTRARALREADEIRAKGRSDAQGELDKARKDAIALGRDAREEAKALVEDAQKESEQVREQTRRAVEGRVAAAEKAAAEVLEEARALHTGMHRLGEALGDQAERILRDVQAAHKRMQADLRVTPAMEERPRTRRFEPAPGPAEELRSPRAAELSESERIIAAAEAARSEEESRSRPRRGAGGSRGSNPFDDIDVPDWVGPER